LNELDYLGLGAAVVASVLFPFVAVSIHARRDRRRNRRNGARRTDKIRL
jgi:hypothetical protein